MTQPHSFMLSYLPAATTPTRIRKTACIGLIIATIIYFAGGMSLAASAISDGRSTAIYYGLTGTLSEIWEFMPKDMASAALAVLILGLILTVCTALVYKASKPATYIAQILLLPTLVLFCIIAALCLIFAALAANPRQLPNQFSPVIVLLITIPGFLITGTAALLTLDILSYLTWLRRRPREEMPKRPFI